MSDPKPLPHREIFEKHGETGTHFKFSHLTDDVGLAANAWLAEQQAIREEESAAKRDVREERTLSIANEANAIASRALAASEAQAKSARQANILAISAIILSAITAISVAIITEFL